MKLRAVLFDADGVLLDSLSPHLQICEDKSREYGLALEIPDAPRLKALIRAGVPISPMLQFFRAVGFPEALAEAADRDYQAIFRKRYAPRPFSGVGPMLATLRTMGLKLGIVTSNVRANVVDGLGQNAAHFDPNSIFAFDTVPEFSKSRALELATNALRVAPAEAIYVGDQPADWRAAQANAMRFLGVAYGWGISVDDPDFDVVGTVEGIPQAIERLVANSPT
jgi:phosphoglycolate phosphatase-like HAD superfamily hydrolase